MKKLVKRIREKIRRKPQGINDVDVEIREQTEEEKTYLEKFLKDREKDQ